jgi:hypothetical protein
MIKLTKQAADYKLQAGEEFLTQGRINKAFPNRPYYHCVMQGIASGMPAAPATVIPSEQAAVTKLWNAVVIELLKDRAANLDAGASLTLELATKDVLTFIAELGNRERAAISGEELDSYTSSYAFAALAQVYGWTAVQVARVSVALRQYAAPAHKKPQADAAVLLARLEAHPSLLTGDDHEIDADITRIHGWLTAKLQRDSVATAANLADSI